MPNVRAMITKSTDLPVAFSVVSSGVVASVVLLLVVVASVVVVVVVVVVDEEVELLVLMLGVLGGNEGLGGRVRLATEQKAEDCDYADYFKMQLCSCTNNIYVLKLFKKLQISLYNLPCRPSSMKFRNGKKHFGIKKRS